MKALTTTEFIDQRLRLYSAHSNIRGIPFIGDGFKQSHRKAVWGMMKRGENADKDTVERISARAASDSDYAHGVGSLEATIIGLAQNFAGSNNVPLFEQYGQFGNRLKKKASASRYIKTKLGKNFRKLFPKDDDLIFDFCISNGQVVEPRFFTPILPLVLINGAEGMGTGHSTYILAYNPKDVAEAITSLIAGKTLKPNTLIPWWNGFNGTVSRDSETGQVSIEGKYHIKEGRGSSIVVTELPIGVESDQYKAHLDKLEEKGLILDYDNLSDKNGFEFIIKVPRDTQSKSPEELKKIFKLISRESENLTVWNGDGVLTRYESVEALLTDWVEWRLARYEDRRQALLKKVAIDISWANMKIKFIRYYLAHHTWFRDTPNKQLIAKLIEEGFERHEDLLSMPMRNLTHDKIKDLEQDVSDLEKLLNTLKKDTAPEMYKRELKENLDEIINCSSKH